ncbi:MAG: glycosyl hydrolase, partial [Anaerolineaceae bacterium]|nr:glycosyl hydrolase [Anaerolineaceae bacterium]
EDGEFDLLIAASSADIREKLTVTLESTVNLPCLLNKESTIREWMEDPIGNKVFSPFFAQVESLSRKAFGAEEGSDDGMGADIMMMFGDMPLASVLLFMQSALPKSADDMVADLLKQVHG